MVCLLDLLVCTYLYNGNWCTVVDINYPAGAQLQTSKKKLAGVIVERKVVSRCKNLLQKYPELSVPLSEFNGYESALMNTNVTARPGEIDSIKHSIARYSWYKIRIKDERLDLYIVTTPLDDSASVRIYGKHLDSAAIGNDDLLRCLAVGTAITLDRLDDIHTINNLT